jgi:Tfp pilus assembly protein PilF
MFCVLACCVVLGLLLRHIPALFTANSAYLFLSHSLFNHQLIGKQQFQVWTLRLDRYQPNASLKYAFNYLSLLDRYSEISGDFLITENLGSRQPLIYLVIADRYAREGQYLQAYRAWKAIGEQSVVIKPLYWAEHYTSLGQPSKAFPFYRIAWQLDETNSEASQFLNQYVLDSREDNTFVISFLETLVANGYARIEDFLWLGRIYAKQGDLINAENWFSKAIDQDPYNQAALMGLADLYQSQNRTPLLRNTCEKLLQFYPENDQVLYFCAVKYLRMGMYFKSEKAVVKAIELKPNFAQYYHVYAQILAAQGKMSLADENYQLALSLEPDAIDILVNYADFLQFLGRDKEAIQVYKKAYEQIPSLSYDPQTMDWFKQKILGQLDRLK